MTASKLRRVGIVVNAWPDPDAGPSGTGRNAQYVAAELASRGVEVNVLVTTSSGTAWCDTRTRTDDGVTVEHVDLYRPSYRSAYRSVLGEAVLSRWLTEARPDVVHVIHPGEVGASGPAVIAAAGIPVVLTACDAYYACHMGHLVNPLERRPMCDLPITEAECARCMAVGTGLDAEWMRPLAEERRRLGAASVMSGPVVADSHFTARQLSQAFLGIDMDVVALPVPAAPTEAPRTPSHHLTLGFFGVPSWRKGLDVLLAAVDHEPNVSLDIHGPRSYAFEAGYGESLADRAATMDNVRWVGGYQPSAAIALMRTVDVVVVPSRAESLPGALKEALAAGRPVIGARVSGIPELVTESSGWLFESEDVADLRRVIRERAADLAGTRALRPHLTLTVATYVDELLAHYERAQASRDQVSAEARLRAGSDPELNAPAVLADEAYQQALIALSRGDRRAALGLLRSLRPNPADRVWTTLTWLLMSPRDFATAFQRVLRVQSDLKPLPSRWQTARRWLRLALA